MADEWKILRNGTGNDAERPLSDSRTVGADNEAQETAPVREAPSGDKNRYGKPLRGGSASTPDSGAGTAMDRDEAVLRYGERMHPSGFEQEPRGEKVPKKHFIAMFCVLGIVCLGWLFKDDVRGTVSWAVSAIRGESVSFSAVAPSFAGLVRFNKPYTWEEFLGVCQSGKGEAVMKILNRQPEFLRSPEGVPLLHVLAFQGATPGALFAAGELTSAEDMGHRDGEGRTLLHLMASGKADVSVLSVMRDKSLEQWANVKDNKGRTPLHVAAASEASPAFVLALRGLGADPVLRDNAGRTPVDHLLETWGGMPRSVTEEERENFSRYGHSVPLPFSQKSDGTRKTRFISIGSQVGDIEGKRYFTLLAEADIEARKLARIQPLAAGDFVGPPPNPEAELMQSFGMDAMTRLREQGRAKGEPLWKSVSLQDGTGAAMAKLKAMLPEARPGTVNYFSVLLAGKMEEPPYVPEWEGWEMPPQLRVALLMQMLQQRVNKSRPQGGLQSTPFATGGGNMTQMAIRSYRERGDNPEARNPLLMVWALLDSVPIPAGKPVGKLDFALVPRKEEEKDKPKVKELDSLRALHARMPREAWSTVGRHLVAAAYVTDARRDSQWGAGMMPDVYKKAGGLRYLRLWGNEDRQDPAEPLRRVIEVSDSVPPDIAAAMAALILRSGPESTALGKDGKPPLAYAEELSATKKIPARVMTMLRSVATDYTPPKKPETPASGGAGRQTSASPQTIYSNSRLKLR